MNYWNIICNNSESELIHYCDDYHLYMLDNCFQQTFLTLPIYLGLLIYCSYQLGLYSYSTITTNHHRSINQWCHSIGLLLLIVIIICQIILVGISNLVTIKLSTLLKIVTLIIYCFWFDCISPRRSSINDKWKSYLLKSFLFIIVLLNISECLTGYLTINPDDNQRKLILLFTSCICWFLHYLLFIIQQRQQVITTGDEPLLSDDDNEFVLKCDELESSIISKLLFQWVSPLLDKGQLESNRIDSSDDLFELPESLSAQTSYQSIISYLDCDQQKRSLIGYMFSNFSMKFASLGFWKLFADSMNMLFPILLNRLLLYLENTSDNDEHSKIGFYYAFGLLLCTILNTVSISYFNFQISKISLKIRCQLIQMTYNKLFRIRSTTMMNEFDTGQILNLANTDVERVMNLVPSLFQLISLPLQLLVTIYLLYLQVNLAFISAIIFIVILIPINKIICDRIKILSEKLMFWKDKRIRLISECLKGIRTIKLHSWEPSFRQKVETLRNEEIKYLKYRKYLDALCVYFWATTPVIISSLVFATYVWLNGDNMLTSSKVFTTLALLGMLIMPLNALPWVLNGLIESFVSIKRLNRFYQLNEQNWLQDLCWVDDDEMLLQLNDCSFSYGDNSDQQQNFELENINLKILKRKPIAITGRVGSGKSTLIKCLLNELIKRDGQLKINQCFQRQAIGYVSQEPWIQDTTIRKNILFGKEFDPQFYNEIIDACQLSDDFQQFQSGDQTLIGNHGQTLSGGQKSRIQLARALYQNFSVYLIDEPFASIDQQVARKIYRKCFGGILKNKSIILITNHIEYLQQDDTFHIYYMDNGHLIDLNHTKLINQMDNQSDQNHDQIDNHKPATIEQEQHEEKEEREHGKIKLAVYIHYIRSIGYFLFTMIITSICLMQMSRSASDFWLSIWTNQQQSSHNNSSLFYLEIFIMIGIINSIITLIRAFLFAYGGIMAATVVHNALLNKLFQTSTLFFDIISFGQIINRFSTDLFNVDDALPFTLNIFLAQISSLIAGLIVTVYGLPWMIIIFVLLTIPYYIIQEYYRKTSRELKRISATTLSPIYSQLDDTIQGLTIIRSFKQDIRFRNEFNEKINIYTRCQYAINAIQQWLNLRLQLIGAFITSSVALIAVYIHYYHEQYLNSSLIGLSLVYSLSLTNLLNGTFSAFAQTELDLISVERIEKLIEKFNDYKETDNDDEKVELDRLWPSKGNIRFDNVSMRYRSDLPLALKNISFEIHPGEHVAIVGRTGSGKSSIFQTLFRLVDIETGSISIDDIDLKWIDRNIIRSRLHIIPQDVFLFNGTIRDNLDPQNRYDDNEIWTALFDCKINMLVDKLGGLDCILDEMGTNLSVGQRHLFGLARAVLNRSRIICMDEITANIDNETGRILDELIETVFKQTTILHIAHKFDSIRNYDRIIYMNDGTIDQQQQQ
ncbi:Multidrug resistance-associated protein 7 [Dermatophagoides pteronyssinus]|uniref:Multidrug resistance-associated protein 7 n=1 Tax=Dermatophagoides pteronyssinus TaxID=6956 RepID=A0ABQ8JQR3_DERPT|nr:Multidrug resistance-associated protein 7 [Dermatophagoides pteronyssinus]